MKRTRNPGFSLIEVLFAVLFLVMVAVAMSTLDTAALRLVSASELQVTAYGLNDEALAFVAIQKRTQANFPSPCAVNTSSCFVACPVDLTACSLSQTRSSVVVGRSRLQYTRQVTITADESHYLVTAKTSWGSGANKQVTAIQLVE